MRILFATHHRAVVGGAESYQRAAIKELRRRGHEIALLHERPLPEGGTPVDEDAVPRWCVADVGTPASTGAALVWAPDVVYSHGLHDPLVEAAVARRRPSLLYAHNYYGTCATGTKCHSIPVPTPCDRIFGPMCIPIVYARGCGTRRPLPLWNEYRRQDRRRVNLELYRFVCVSSRHMQREYARHGVVPERLRLLPLFPSIDAGSGEAIACAGEGTAPREIAGRVLLLGRITALKGAELIVDAVAWASRRLGRTLTLVVVGEGPGLSEVLRRASKTGTPVELAGWLERSALPGVLRTVDVLAMPSVWPEPFGLAGIEAGRFGVPAVAFAVGGIPDWLIPGESGELAPADPPSATGFARALVRVLGDDAYRDRLGRGARCVAQRYAAEVHWTELDRLVREIVDGSRRSPTGTAA